MKESRDYRIAAVDRALSVMEALEERSEQGVTELAARLGMTKSLVFRILHTLESRGYVVRDVDRAVFSLGFRVSVLGERAGTQKGLLLVARPVMDALRDETSENVNLVVRDGERALVVATREGRHSMRLFAQAGRHAPMHAGGGSMLLLAFAPEEVQEAVLGGPLARYTPHTVEGPAELRRRIDRIRRQGWNVSHDDLDEGAFSIAAPVRSPEGEVIAAVSVAGAVTRLDESRRNSHLEAVCAAAERISRRLGTVSQDESPHAPRSTVPPPSRRPTPPLVEREDAERYSGIVT